MHESRQDDPSQNITEIPNDLLFKILRAGDHLVALAPQLITNRTSNLAECFMSTRAKFDGGKFYNRFQKGPLNINAKVQACDGSWVLSGTLQLWKRSPTKELDLFSKPMLLILRQTGRMTEPDNDLLFKILRAGDHLVALAPQLITNRTSNLALVLYVHES